jgi:hypothetical protein
MKIKKEKVKDLGKVGFVKIVKESDSPIYLTDNNTQKDVFDKLYQEYLKFIENYVINDEHDDPLTVYEGQYVYDLGHSSRGQHYYILIQKDLQVTILASKADGDGTHVKVGDIFQKLISKGFIESS